MSTLAPRPFATLGLKPFLASTAQNKSEIQSEYIKRSRLWHPDRFPQNDTEAQEKAESMSSQLNSDYAKIRDFWTLVQTVTALAAPSANPAAKSSLPPELAAEYFDLQEQMEDFGVDHPESQKKMASFSAEVEAKLEEAEKNVIAFSESFPYQGLGDAAPPWSTEDISRLKLLLEQVKYYRSFLRDIKSRTFS